MSPILQTDAWITPLWTTVAGGVIVIVFQRTYKWIALWQESRRSVDDKDHQLLHEIADVMMDKPAGPFSSSHPGIVTRFGALEQKVNDINDKLDTVIAQTSK